ncbi:MAG: PaaI family thioesterase [Flavobacteriales bacterium]
MEEKITAIKQFLQIMPSNKIFGLEIVKLTEQELLLKVPFKEEFIGDFVQRRWHGGILASIADSAGGIMGTVTFESYKDRINTIDLRVDYLHRTHDVPIYAKAKIIKTGKRIIVIDVDLYHEENKIHTTARVTCSVLRN